jgi:hypothetical protein
VVRRESRVTRFGVCFLTTFGELAFGGLFALAIPPFFKVERGYYKSSAAVYLSAALIAATGLAFLALRGDQRGAPAALWLFGLSLTWAVFCLVLGLYLFTLWTDLGHLRARAYSLCLAIGLIAVVAGALTLEPPNFGAVAGLAYALTAVFSSLILGLASGAMLFGHWYLIDPNLPVDYLRSFVRLLGAAIVADLVALAVGVSLVTMFGGGSAAAAVRDLARADLAIMAFRLLLGPIASIVLVWMCLQTLKIPQTMAATGLLYITVMSVLVGELLGRFILFRTGVPL